jgi:hypothetical protein
MVNGKKNKKNGSKNPTGKDALKIGKVLVLKNEKVLPDHFWIGISTVDDPVS